ncbi:MAG: CcoQ/FixQ family Cbb3-type cytochrome c oxidase assembly chaperone [Bacteroidia bacterium]
MGQFLDNIKGYDLYLIFSLLVFVIFFIALLIGLLKIDKKYIEKMENMPFEKNEKTN